jgi:hypothetical protein
VSAAGDLAAGSGRPGKRVIEGFSEFLTARRNSELEYRRSSDRLRQFFRSLLNDLTSGLLFFGGPSILWRLSGYLRHALVVYYILRLLRDSRAWQLLKGCS